MARPEEKNVDTQQQKGFSQSVEQLERSASETANRVARTAVDVSEQAARVGTEVVRKNNETAQQLWEAATQMAAQLSKHSADQFGRVLGISGEDAQHALRNSSENVGALVESATVIASVWQESSKQWLETVRHPSRRLASLLFNRSGRWGCSC